MVGALRESGKQLEGRSSTLASYVTSAASHLEQFSGGIRDRDVNQIVRDVERFARQQPTLFLGGAFVLGVAAARFLKSSGPDAGTGASGSIPRAPSHSTPKPWPDESVADAIGGRVDAGAARTPGTTGIGGTYTRAPEIRG